MAKKLKIHISLLSIGIYFTTANYVNGQNKVIPIGNNLVPGAITDSSYIEIDEYQDKKTINISKVITPTLIVFQPRKKKVK